ncbi:MAG: N-acetylmuramoyl-L-alanine amidase, partial [Pseudomonadota bacterium]
QFRRPRLLCPGKRARRSQSDSRLCQATDRHSAVEPLHDRWRYHRSISLDDKDDLIASVLLDLSQSATIQDSLELGSNVLKHIGKISKLNNRQVQQAGFAVLKAPDMPSILIETAFISNPGEEKKLRNPKHQQKLAKAVFSGIRKHLESRQA